MALVGNRSVLLKSPGRFLAGTVACVDRSNWTTKSQMRSAAFDSKAGTPYGHLAGSSWKLPQKAGGMSSINFAVASVAAAGLAVGGITADAITSFAITVADAAGQLISSGSGAASFAITSNTPLLTASLNAAGSVSFSINTNTPLLGALAGGVGSASFAISGTLTPYAIGIMTGTTAVATNVVNANIVSVNGYSVTGTGQTGAEWGPA